MRHDLKKYTLSPYFAKTAKSLPTQKRRLLKSKYFPSPTTKRKHKHTTKAFKVFSKIFHRLCKSKPILIQELVRDCPWKFVIAVSLLNKTNGCKALPVFGEIMHLWPTPEDMRKADINELTAVLSCLGLQETRAKRFIELSDMMITNPPQVGILHKSRAKEANGASYPNTPISHLPGCGKYALDSFRIFSVGGDEWKHVLPSDKELIKYLKWRWAVEEMKIWDSVKGVIGDADRPYLESLPSQLTQDVNLFMLYGSPRS